MKYESFQGVKLLIALPVAQIRIQVKQKAIAQSISIVKIVYLLLCYIAIYL